MDAHGAVIRAADAAEEWAIASRHSGTDIDKLLCGLTDDLNERGLGLRVRVAGLGRCPSEQ